jgi:hypothetical protein
MYSFFKEGAIKLLFILYLLTLFTVGYSHFVFREDFNSLPADGKATLILNCIQYLIAKVS